MSEQQNRIATLLNSGSDTTTDPSTGATTPDTYDIPPGQSATDAQLGIDSTPDALISVDGHQVASGDNGLSIDVAPDGSTHVIHGPQDGTQPGGGQYGQAPGTVPVLTQPGQNGQPGQPGTQIPGQNGTQPPSGDVTGSGAPSQSQPDQTGVPQDGTQPPDGGAPPQGQADPTGMTPDPSQDTTPIEHLHGIGDHAAQADLAVHGPGPNMPATVTHQNPDGSQDITIPKGPDNPHAITVHVKPNDDGSLDITVPKSETNPHEIKIHVQPDKHIDLNITQDKDGHLKIDAHDHPPDQKGDWPGLKGPAGQGQQPGSGLPGAGDIPTPEVPSPKMPDGGGAPPPGGGGGPPMGGGGPPSGGGGGGPKIPDPPKTTQPAVPTDGSGFASIRQDSIRALGKDIDSGPVQTMDNAHKDAAAINVGYPGFGVAGAISGLAGAHTEVRNAGAQQFSDGHTSLSKWVPTLDATAANWKGAEDTSTTQVNGVPH
jgi:hypothetical protein